MEEEGDEETRADDDDHDDDGTAAFGIAFIFFQDVRAVARARVRCTRRRLFFDEEKGK